MMVPVVVAVVVGGGIFVGPSNDLIARSHWNNIYLEKLGQLFQIVLGVLRQKIS